jgi:hypothetical protein
VTHDLRLVTLAAEPGDICVLASGGPRRIATFVALPRFRAAIFGRVLTGSQPDRERRLIAFPKAQDKAS